MKFDLDSLSLKDLRTLEANINRAIVTLERQQKRQAIAAVQAQAKKFGFPLEELFPPAGERRA